MLSIIIPTFNEGEYLPKLLDSIKKQDFDDYEIIISDNKSKDNTRKIAEKYNCKIVDGGLPAQGRNNGALVANGDLLLFLDADVILPKRFLLNALDEFKKKNLDIATCSIIPIENKKRDHLLYSIADSFMKGLQFIKPIGGGYCILVKKELHIKNNGFNENCFLGEDWDYINKLSKKNKFRFLKNVEIYLSARRLEKEGRAKLVMKYIKWGSLQLLRKRITLEKIEVDYEYGCFNKKD